MEMSTSKMGYIIRALCVAIISKLSHVYMYVLQHGHPYISAMINNGTLSYDHDRDGTHTELAGCESQFRNAKEETYVAIRFERKKLTVALTFEELNRACTVKLTAVLTVIAGFDRH